MTEIWSVTGLLLCVRFASHLMRFWTSWMICPCVCGHTRRTSTSRKCSRRSRVSTYWSLSSSRRQWKNVTGNAWCGSCAFRGCCLIWHSVISGTSTSSRMRWLSRMYCSLHKEKWLWRNSSNKYGMQHEMLLQEEMALFVCQFIVTGPLTPRSAGGPD